MFLAFIYSLFVLALLLAEIKADRRAQFIFKPAAAFGFILLAIQFGALETDFGRLVIAGLFACAIGDVFLLSRKRVSLFKSGMAAFAIGHLLYIIAAKQIISQDLSAGIYIGTWLIGIVLGLATFYVLKPNLSQDMLWPVGIYTLIISAMIVYALQTDFTGAHKYFLLAAILFAISDVFVARDRFIKASPKNAFVITPFYFAAQALFAFSTSV